MLIVNTIDKLEKILFEVHASEKSVGFVPTMGALHAGHISLVKQAVTDNDYTVVSVFVNPTQFNNLADLQKYPRNLEKDVALLQASGCDLVFAPSKEEIYSNEELNKHFEFDFGGLDQVMEGTFRPGHFNGVVQVVSKLFKLVKPGKAYFGEKDFQQLAIIHRMTELLNFDVEIVDCPIVREESGLAMSSRNERLTPEQRNIAVGISKVLVECRNFVPTYTPEKLKQWVKNEIYQIQGLELEYFEIVNTKTLQPAKSWNEPTVGCIAVYCGDVRLIDNIRCS
ncbi:MAG: pantoate--beta-alanine ligase [Paludibacter sp.]|nr:pantoate--beta-alanine ligase [Paludibacter sp.]MDD4198653.1 pantoate--beta-alanine ligase [Paludibacter sp.]MDD4428357.1 pantoate--beta-alanine ligase [Paludibacter sp.]